MKSLILAALVAATPAVAQECAPIDIMAEALTSRFGEAVVAEGIAGNGELVQLWANPDTRTWTLVVVMPAGISCMVASGTDYSETAPEPNV